jgi:peptidoglycan hydrolase-like protein with peptidoglycan-binding domain
LREAGLDPGPIDGILGPKTKAAMQRYQKSLRLKKITART